MRVSPINNIYSLKAQSLRKRPENSPVITKTDNLSFRNITNYKECFERALTFPIRDKGDFRVAFKELYLMLEKEARFPANKLKPSFEETLHALGNIDPLFHGKDEEIVLAEDPITNAVLAFANPTGEYVTFLPPINKYVPNVFEPVESSYATFAKIKRDFSFARPGEYVEIWGSTGLIKEEINYWDGKVVRHIYYNPNGTENAWKTFFYGTK